jgi:hypothetical protein
MNKEIMSNPSEGIFKKIGKAISNFFKSELFKFIVFIFILCGIVALAVSYLVWQDRKDYPYGEYEMTYRVYYTENNVKEYTITHNRPIYMRSSKGSNEIHKHGWGDVIETSAPIEVVRYVNKAK